MLAKGDAAPDFELEDADGKLWRLSDLRGQKVILYFYPADDTPGCTVEACDFRDSRDELTEAGYLVLGVSPQGPQSHRRFSTKYGLNFPLLVDKDLSVAARYGATAPKDGSHGGASARIKRSTFVIDDDGNIAEALYGIHAKGHVDELKQALVT
jgi:peroxiredoxin Q/BCP